MIFSIGPFPLRKFVYITHQLRPPLVVDESEKKVGVVTWQIFGGHDSVIFILKCSWQAQQNAANYKLIPLSYLRNDVWAIDKITKIFKGADRSNKYCAIVK